MTMVNFDKVFYEMFPPLAPLPCTLPCTVKCKGPPKKEEKEDTMYTDKDIETRQRDHMLRRAEKICYSKENDAAKTFHIMDDEPPWNFTDLKARMDAGKYIVDADLDKKSYGPLCAVKWRDPAVPADKTGFEAWQKLLKTAYVNTKDQIIVLPVADGLKALQTFEAQTIQ